MLKSLGSSFWSLLNKKLALKVIKNFLMNKIESLLERSENLIKFLNWERRDDTYVSKTENQHSGLNFKSLYSARISSIFVLFQRERVRGMSEKTEECVKTKERKERNEKMRWKNEINELLFDFVSNTRLSSSELVSECLVHAEHAWSFSLSPRIIQVKELYCLKHFSSNEKIFHFFRDIHCWFSH